jgi:RNA recognition motif-containing protein
LSTNHELYLIGITSKRQVREKEEYEMAEYEKKLRQQYGFKETSKRNPPKPRRIKTKIAANPDGITRLFIKNLNVRDVDQPQLCELVEGITHIDWIMDRQTQKWYGSVFVEVSTPEMAGKAVGSLNKQKIYGRVIQCNYSPPDRKSIWPPPNTKI